MIPGAQPLSVQKGQEATACAVLPPEVTTDQTVSSTVSPFSLKHPQSLLLENLGFFLENLCEVERTVF